ncbi:MAG: Uma2 family endonuclease [Hyphomicrobiales bacterium]|nr:Uma2 family endonuclease [Hyphomicrobiales bacterium]
MSTALTQMTVDEFLLWAEGKEGRWELHYGVPVMISDLPVAMSPERLAHTRAKGTAFIALVDALKNTGLRCEAFTDGVAVKVDARTTFEPDASVACGPRRPEDTIVVSDPIVVVEVLSPNTAGIDHGRKLSGYFSLPSVQHYLILDPDRRVVIHHKRGRDAIETRVLNDGVVKLNPPGFDVAVAALFPATSS